MQEIRYQNKNVYIVWMTAVIFFKLMVATIGYAGNDAGNKIVATGTDFEMTQQVLDAYTAFFVSQELRWSRDEIAKTALKYELLSREYRKKQGLSMGAEAPAGSSDKVEARILDGKKYIQSILDGWVVPGAAIEAYYRSNPEKYSIGKTPEGKMMFKPLDEQLKSEIRFLIIEAKKEVIAKEYVDSLISKYNIVMRNGA